MRRVGDLGVRYEAKGLLRNSDLDPGGSVERWYLHSVGRRQEPPGAMSSWDFDLSYKEFTATGPLRNMVVRMDRMSRGDLFDL